MAAILLSGAAISLGTATAADAATPPVTCGGMTATAAATAGYNVFDFSGQPGPKVFTSTTGGNDWIYGTTASDVLSGSVGDDLICGGAGGDTLFGNSGNDKIHGDDGADHIYGDDFGSGNGSSSDGNDVIFGGPDSDTMYGNGGVDDIRGGGGASDSGDGGDRTDTCSTPDTETRISC